MSRGSDGAGGGAPTEEDMALDISEPFDFCLTRFWLISSAFL